MRNLFFLITVLLFGVTIQAQNTGKQSGEAPTREQMDLLLEQMAQMKELIQTQSAELQELRELNEKDSIKETPRYLELSYNDVELTARVVYNKTQIYMGDVIIPRKVKHNDRIYTITAIGGKAFLNCRKLRSVTIPNTVTIISDSAFYGCWQLQSIDIPNSVSWILPYAFYECKSLTKIVLPEKLTYLYHDVFKFCDNLSDVTIGPKVYIIQKYAFGGCHALKTITLPVSVSYIESFAFWDCKDMIIRIENPKMRSVESSIFGVLKTDVPKAIYIPKGTLEYYKYHTYFSQYSSMLIEY